jgi:hypothetical protein
MKPVYILITVLFTSNAMAEYRCWSDKKGNSLEAEFICESAGKIVLRGRDSKEYKLSMDSLSVTDQRFLRTKLPPKINIEFSKTQDRHSKSYSYAIVEMQCEASLKKTSRMPYDGDLRATLFVIGENDYRNEYILVDRTDSDFNFRDNPSHAFQGSVFSMREYKSSSSNNQGTEYKGFVIVVIDKDENVIAMKSNRDQFSGNIDDLTKLKTGARFGRHMQEKSTMRSF